MPAVNLCSIGSFQSFPNMIRLDIEQACSVVSTNFTISRFLPPCSCEVPVFSLNSFENLHSPRRYPLPRSLVSCATMGKSTWRMQEILLLEMLDNSDTARQLYESASQQDSGWWSKSVNYYTTAYLDKFKDDCFPRETDSELAARQARTPSAELSRFEAETAEARQQRLEMIRKVRICLYAKRRPLTPSNSESGPM